MRSLQPEERHSATHRDDALTHVQGEAARWKSPRYCGTPCPCNGRNPETEVSDHEVPGAWGCEDGEGLLG